MGKPDAGGKRQGSGVTPQNLSVLQIPSGESTDACFTHVKTKLTVPSVAGSKFIHTMVDTGNKAGQPLMAENIYRQLDPTGELEEIDINITGAAKDSKLEILGIPTKPVEVKFYNPENPNQKNIRYDMYPIVIRNLTFPLLLSWQDLKTLKAHIDIENDELVINGPQGPVLYPLVGAPRKPTATRTCGEVIRGNGN